MPIYEFKCTKCRKKYEEILSFSEPKPETCKEESCEGNLELQISKSSFELKGGGWYKQGYNK